MNSTKRYEDLKFVIRCANVWKELKKSDEKLNKSGEHRKK